MKILKILAVDSSSATASVAIAENDKIIAEYFANCGLTHSETLAPMIQSILCNSKVDINEIDLFAVCNGPGSFTGLMYFIKKPSSERFFAICAIYSAKSS